MVPPPGGRLGRRQRRQYGSPSVLRQGPLRHQFDGRSCPGAPVSHVGEPPRFPAADVGQFASRRWRCRNRPASAGAGRRSRSPDSRSQLNGPSGDIPKLPRWPCSDGAGNGEAHTHWRRPQRAGVKHQLDQGSLGCLGRGRSDCSYRDAARDRCGRCGPGLRRAAPRNDRIYVGDLSPGDNSVAPYECGSEDNPCDTIEHAVAHAASAEALLLANGVLREGPVTIDKSLLIEGTKGPVEDTVLEPAVDISPGEPGSASPRVWKFGGRW